MIKSLVVTLVALLFSTLLFAQNIGDSIQIISYGNRTYNGQVYKIDKDGYFIKGNYGTIFLNKSEIKEYQIFNDQVEKQNNSLHINNTTEDSMKIETTKVERQTFKELTKNNRSEFYKKYDLKNLNISNFNSLGNYRNYKLFVKHTWRHVRKNKEITLMDKMKFSENLNLELTKTPNQEYLRYTKMWKISAGLIGGLLPYTIESLLFLKSSKCFYKSFLVYLKDQRSDIVTIDD